MILILCCTVALLVCLILSLLGYITPSLIPSRNLNKIEPFSCCSTSAMSFLISETPMVNNTLVSQDSEEESWRYLAIPSKRYCFILTVG